MRPCLMQAVQTRARVTRPSTIILTRWRFGKNRRRFTRVVRRPTPPLFLARPRREYVRPTTTPFPQLTQTFIRLL